MKQRIEMHLLECLQESHLQDITVAQLCRSVGISRKTFYYHYSGIEACFDSLIHRIMSGCSVHIAENVPTPTDLLTLYTVELEYWKGQKTFLDCICKNSFFLMLLNHYLQYNTREERYHLKLLNTPGMEYDADILNFYIGGSLSLILQWSQRGFDTPIPEMAQKLIRLVHHPLLPVCKT